MAIQYIARDNYLYFALTNLPTREVSARGPKSPASRVGSNVGHRLSALGPGGCRQRHTHPPGRAAFRGERGRSDRFRPPFPAHPSPAPPADPSWVPLLLLPVGGQRRAPPSRPGNSFLQLRARGSGVHAHPSRTHPLQPLPSPRACNKSGTVGGNLRRWRLASAHGGLVNSPRSPGRRRSGCLNPRERRRLPEREERAWDAGRGADGAGGAGSREPRLRTASQSQKRSGQLTSITDSGRAEVKRTRLCEQYSVSGGRANGQKHCVQ
ncbi:uncharacterized protein [Dasypus novemcinctus]|uniref:uncharacterized protein n=1 Tax=Dasypus novemcinctus TaxID=9361 RepID=UPI0039C93B70